MISRHHTPFVCAVSVAIAGMLLSQKASAEVPAEIERLMEQRDDAVERVEVTFRREMRDLRAKYVTQGRQDDVELIEKVLEGIDPYKVGDPVLGRWLIKAGGEVAMTELKVDGTAVIGLPKGKVLGTWKRVEDKVLVHRYGVEGVFTEIQVIEGKLIYHIPAKRGKMKLVGEKIADEKK